MNEILKYESFPLLDVISSNVIALFTFVVGSLLLSGFNIWIAIAYFTYCILTVIFFIWYKCSNCYYYGKRCSTSWGLLVVKLFNKGDNTGPLKSTKFVAPVFIIPMVGGLILLLTSFDVKTLFLFIILIIITIFRLLIPKIFYKKISCSHCKLKENCSVFST